MENHSYSSIAGSSSAPYINSVISACGLATNYHSLTHPSLPNYLGLTDGGPLSQISQYQSDCDPTSCPPATSNNVFNELGSKRWMSFAESMPTACDRSSSGSYAAKHNPAVYYLDLLKSCPNDDVPLGSPPSSALLKALSKGRGAPALSFVTPNLCDDMHSCSIGSGDQWLATWLPLITGSHAYLQGSTVVFIVWDEGEPESPGENCAASASDQSCHVPAIVIAPSVRHGTQVSTMFTHYSLLKTIEVLLRLPQLGGAKTAQSMVKGFHL
jgi:hypothetical protein